MSLLYIPRRGTIGFSPNMTAYYNEIDPQKAQWMRELMKVGVIAPGEVDERSICDVQPDDLQGFSQCHFFAGIGVWSYALQLAGWPDDRECWTGSCPCPSFSAAGKGQGFDDPRHLWPDWFRLARVRRPPVILGEQVAAAIGHGWLDLVQTDLEAEGYAVGKAVLGACSVGAPHIRQRLYFVGAQPEAVGRREECALYSGSDERDGAQGRTARLNAGRFTERGAHAEHAQRRPNLLGDGRNGPDGGRTKAHGEPRAYGEVLTGDSGNAAGERCGEARPSSGRSAERLGYTSEPFDCNDPQRTRLEGHRQHERNGNQPGWLDQESARSIAASGATRGFWSDCDWWYGRDGKYRPIEPGISPLATGVTNRVLKLRGYGDAICAEVAKTWIEVCKECL